ncbi:helix-turn-helix domain-containing protein, partial [Burkholderia multivorans]|nr:helix-turn-helix domain-containing protein [Burkholderia multivorans]
REAALAAGVAALTAEIDAAGRMLAAPAARLVAQHTSRAVRLDDVEALFASNALVVDACRYTVRDPRTTVPLARRPVLFVLARALGEAWPADVPRDALIAAAFRTRHPDDTHRARLRVEIGRLRALLRPLANVTATPRGFALEPLGPRDVVVLARPVDDRHADVLALLADGEAWSSSALALALGASQRTVQRALDALAEAGKAHAFGRGRARRWTTPPLPGFATTLLLPMPVAGD